MREVEERTSESRLPRSPGAVALAVFGLMLIAFVSCSLAADAPDNILKSPSSDDAAAETGKPPSAASVKIAAIRDAVSRTLISYGNDVQDAYHRELVNNSKIEGEITIVFKVMPNGDVVDVNVEKSSLNWPPLEEEILNRIKAWKFPAFEGEAIQVTVPYKFGAR